MAERIHWRCFHCGETFTRAQERWAREHFGRAEDAEPVCLIRTAGEGALLTALREAEDQLVGYRTEDQQILRAMWSMQVDHQQALIREEQRGYDKGLRDGQALDECGGVAGSGTYDYRDLGKSAARALNRQGYLKMVSESPPSRYTITDAGRAALQAAGAQDDT